MSPQRVEQSSPMAAAAMVPHAIASTGLVAAAAFGIHFGQAALGGGIALPPRHVVPSQRPAILFQTFYFRRYGTPLFQSSSKLMRALHFDLLLW